jgi:hypothetical protein
MRRVVVLAEAAEDLEEARRFYEASEAGVGDYCVTSLPWAKSVSTRPEPAALKTTSPIPLTV